MVTTKLFLPPPCVYQHPEGNSLPICLSWTVILYSCSFSLPDTCCPTTSTEWHWFLKEFRKFCGCYCQRSNYLLISKQWWKAHLLNYNEYNFTLCTKCVISPGKMVLSCRVNYQKDYNKVLLKLLLKTAMKCTVHFLACKVAFPYCGIADLK